MEKTPTEIESVFHAYWAAANLDVYKSSQEVWDFWMAEDKDFEEKAKARCKEKPLARYEPYWEKPLSTRLRWKRTHTS